MLTGEQTTKIERLQFFALKNIYGFSYSHRELLELAGLQTLHERREEMTLKFANKTAANDRFKHWFPTRRAGGRRKNNCVEYLEMSARTDRRRNSPIYYYRRILNQHRIDYDVRKKKNAPAP